MPHPSLLAAKMILNIQSKFDRFHSDLRTCGSSVIISWRIFTQEDEDRLSYVINLQETNHEYEEEEELYLNKKVNAIIEDKKQECYPSDPKIRLTSFSGELVTMTGTEKIRSIRKVNTDNDAEWTNNYKNCWIEKSGFCYSTKAGFERNTDADSMKQILGGFLWSYLKAEKSRNGDNVRCNISSW